MKVVRIAAWIGACLSAVPGCGRTPSKGASGSDAAAAGDAAQYAEVSPSDVGGFVDVDVATVDANDSADEVSLDTASTGPSLLGAALVAAPTGQGFGLNVVLRAGDPRGLRAHVRKTGMSTWMELGQPSMPAFDVAEWSVSGLDAGQMYEYEVFVAAAPGSNASRILASGTAVTKRPAGASFTFDLLTDSHIPACDSVAEGLEICGDDYLSADEATLLDVSADIRKDQPDFVIHLGDILDFHRFGFNEPPPDSRWSRLAYLNYRRLMVDTLSIAAHFPTIGNWDGESGCNSPDEIQRSSSQRMLYIPGPKPGDYPEGGSPNEDYYAFTWGDALFVVLNVMTYTPTCHLLSGDPGSPDDWTLGAAQRAWLESTLAGATAKWRFTFIHHTVGGNAGDGSNSAYGRGGGRAAHVGEQGVIHEMLRKYGAQVFFYGHDHVFTDMVVDGIHYTLPGSAGAPWKFDSSITGYSQYWPDSGHGRVTITPTQVVVDFVAVGGSLLSSYSLN